jgi:hypothetical protein
LLTIVNRKAGNMRNLYAYKTVEDMANGNYIASMAAGDDEFTHEMIDGWTSAGYTVTEHSSRNKRIRVHEAKATLTIVNKPGAPIKLYTVHGDYAAAVVAARNPVEAAYCCSHYPDTDDYCEEDRGEERGYPWEGCKAYEVTSVESIVLAPDVKIPHELFIYEE